jgi:hypothetical protein
VFNMALTQDAAAGGLERAQSLINPQKNAAEITGKSKAESEYAFPGNEQVSDLQLPSVSANRQRLRHTRKMNASIPALLREKQHPQRFGSGLSTVILAVKY